jgi:hypothetical protein
MYAEHDMDMALTEYMDLILADYARWSQNLEYNADRLNVTINRGSKFYKVVVGTGVHSFVCRKAHDQWKVGDVLKAASWAQPAKNFVRGNVLSQSYINPVRWTGV